MIKLGLIGCGGMGQGHAHALTDLGPDAKLVATVDIDEQRARESAVLLGAEKSVTNFEDILGDVDAVLVSLPHHLHHKVGMDCLKAGKHVLMEKPLANTEQECLDLIEAADRYNRVLMVAYCMRFHPLVRRFKEVLDQRAYGEVYQISIWTEQYTFWPSDHWGRSAANLGGGQLFSHGCHYIDLLLWMLGRPVEGTHVGTNYGTPWMEQEGTSNVAMKFESGALGYHFGTWGAKGTRLGYSFHAHCTEGMLELHLASGKLIAHANGEETVLFEAESDKPLRNETMHFLDCIRTGSKPLTNGPDSLQGLRVIWRLYDAERRGVVADLRGLGIED